MIQLTYRVQAVFLSYIQVGPLLPSEQRLTVSKKPDLLTETYFHRSAVSKNGDLLTGQRFQRSSVSEKAVLLTGQAFQVSSVRKNGDLLTGDSFLSYYGNRLRDYVLM